MNPSYEIILGICIAFCVTVVVMVSCYAMWKNYQNDKELKELTTKIKSFMKEDNEDELP